MSTKEAYKQKMEAELDLAQAKLAELKAQAKSFAADAHIKYAKQFEELEHGVDTTKAKLKELGNAAEDNWERFKDGVESAWGKVGAAFHDTAAKFKKH
jgi:hypothetical protein